MSLPSTRTIEAFVAAARTGSLASAGADLGMSVSALSRRLASLERDLGVQLLDRLPRGVALTGAGETYLAHASAVLDRLRAAAGEVRRDEAIVRVTTIPALASRWLLPRLPRFLEQHRGIDVDVRTSMHNERLDDGAFDIAIRLARNDQSNEPALIPIHVLPVWSSARPKEVSLLEGIGQLDLLGPDHRPEFWSEWLAAAGLDEPAKGIRGVDPLLLYEQTMAGHGVAIGIEPLVTDLLTQGRMRGLTDRRVRSSRSFFLLHGRSAPTRAARFFETWLRSLV